MCMRRPTREPRRPDGDAPRAPARAPDRHATRDSDTTDQPERTTIHCTNRTTLAGTDRRSSPSLTSERSTSKNGGVTARSHRGGPSTSTAVRARRERRNPERTRARVSLLRPPPSPHTQLARLRSRVRLPRLAGRRVGSARREHGDDALLLPLANGDVLASVVAGLVGGDGGIEPEALAQVVGHVLGPARPLHVLEGGEVDGVDYAVVHGDDAVGDDVGDDKHDDARPDRVVLVVVGDRVEDEEGGEPARHRRRPADEQPQHALHRLVDHGLRHVLCDEAEGDEARSAEGVALDRDEDVAVVRDELDRLLEAPHDALGTLHHELQPEVLVLQVLRVVVDGGEDEADELADGDDERAQRHRAQVLAQHHARRLPQVGAAEGADLARPVLDGLRADVPLRDGAGHGRPHRRLDKLEGPEDYADVADEEDRALGEVGPHHEDKVAHADAVAEDGELERQLQQQRPEDDGCERLEDLAALLEDGDEAADRLARSDEEDDDDQGEDQLDDGEHGVPGLLGVVGGAGERDVVDGLVEGQVTEPVRHVHEPEGGDEHEHDESDDQQVNDRRGKEPEEDCPDEAEHDGHADPDRDLDGDRLCRQEPLDTAEDELCVRGQVLLPRFRLGRLADRAELVRARLGEREGALRRLQGAIVDADPRRAELPCGSHVGVGVDGRALHRAVQRLVEPGSGAVGQVADHARAGRRRVVKRQAAPNDVLGDEKVREGRRERAIRAAGSRAARVRRPAVLRRERVGERPLLGAGRRADLGRAELPVAQRSEDVGLGADVGVEIGVDDFGHASRRRALLAAVVPVAIRRVEDVVEHGGVLVDRPDADGDRGDPCRDEGDQKENVSAPTLLRWDEQLRVLLLLAAGAAGTHFVA
mmetsp:Transcript_2374/g.3819  ORF Transcript_2374/g.3819 Transcript_2374/m.3819 type:complete len:874 (+) Transcript_2374:25-2646(+)